MIPYNRNKAKYLILALVIFMPFSSQAGNKAAVLEKLTDLL